MPLSLHNTDFVVQMFGLFVHRFHKAYNSRSQCLLYPPTPLPFETISVPVEPLPCHYTHDLIDNWHTSAHWAFLGIRNSPQVLAAHYHYEIPYRTCSVPIVAAVAISSGCFWALFPNMPSKSQASIMPSTDCHSTQHALLPIRCYTYCHWSNPL